MKKLLFILLATFIFCAASGQTVNNKPPVDTVATDATPLISYNDLKPLLESLGDVPMKYAEPIRAALINLIQQRAQEYAQKKKLEQKPK